MFFIIHHCLRIRLVLLLRLLIHLLQLLIHRGLLLHDYLLHLDLARGALLFHRGELWTRLIIFAVSLYFYAHTGLGPLLFIYWHLDYVDWPWALLLHLWTFGHVPKWSGGPLGGRTIIPPWLALALGDPILGHLLSISREPMSLYDYAWYWSLSSLVSLSSLFHAF